VIAAAIVVVAALLVREVYHFASGKIAPRSSLNISCFAFRDVDRDGVYDVGDRPYAGLEVELRRPRGRPVTERSNLAGFANFKMALGSRGHPVNRPGPYSVSATPPACWSVTSGNAEQNLAFIEVVGSPSGLALREPVAHIGIAPDLAVSGVVGRAGSGLPAGTSLLVVSPTGEAHAVALSSEGEFSFPACAGVWKLVFQEGERPAATREVDVGGYPVVVSRSGGPGSDDVPRIPTEVRTVGFDDLTTSDTLYEIPQGYAGLAWNNWIATHQKFYQIPGTVNATVSAEYMAYTSSGQAATIWSDQPFDFVGSMVGLAWDDAAKGNVIVEAWRGDALVYQDEIGASSTGPVYFAADYRRITRLRFRHETNWQVVLDDFEFRQD
jgi:hypothetical protein